MSTKEIHTRTCLVTDRVAAEYLGVSRETLAVWRASGRVNIPYVRIGKLVRYNLSDLDRFIKTSTVTNQKV